VFVGLGLSVGLPQFGYRSEHPETEATSKAAMASIRRFFINPD